MKLDRRLLKMPLLTLAGLVAAFACMTGFRLFHPVSALLFLAWMLLDGPAWLLALWGAGVIAAFGYLDEMPLPLLGMMVLVLAMIRGIEYLRPSISFSPRQR